MDNDKALIERAEKAVDAWRGIDEYRQTADLIDLLVAEIATLTTEIARKDSRLQASPYGDDKIDELEGSCDFLRFRAETAENQLANLAAQRDEAQRREKAAVENMKAIADVYREECGDDGICGLCAFDADHGLDGHANECPGFGSNACFQWCGPQESGEVQDGN